MPTGRATAIANNDIVHVAWSYDQAIPGCSGFRVYRVTAADPGGVALGSSIGFENARPTDDAGAALPHEPVDPNAPPALIKAFKWRDLLAPDQRGIKVRYRIVPMQGDDDHATPLPGLAPLETAEVEPSGEMGHVSAFFNRGILSTQALTRTLKKLGNPSLDTLQKAIRDPAGVVRRNLSGQLEDAVLTLLKRREKEGGECFAALYELTDDTLLKALVAAKRHLHIVLSNNTGDKKKAYDNANKPARDALKKSGAELISRFLPDSRSIGHNKFMVYVDSGGVAREVLSGSTNWTATGLCTQNNNAILIRSEKLAQRYMDYWERLKADTKAQPIPDPPKGVSALQGADLRAKDAKAQPPIPLAAGEGSITIWPSPNTPTLVPQSKAGAIPPTPPDMQELFDACANAKQAILLLVFQPGAANNESSRTIVKHLLAVGRRKPELLIRGAISDEAEALEFEAGRTSTMNAQMVAPAGIVKDVKSWMREIYKAGHAIVHDKIIVIDPFQADCVVATGSHNLGFKASYNNDENLLIVRGNQRLAQAYAAHVADVFEHYRWRWFNRRDAERAAAAKWVKDGAKPATADDQAYATEKFFKADIPTGPDAHWQDRYFNTATLACLERQFWVGQPGPLPVRKAAQNITAGLKPDEVRFRAAKAALRKKQKDATKNGAAGSNGAHARATKKKRGGKKTARSRSGR